MNGFFCGFFLTCVISSPGVIISFSFLNFLFFSFSLFYYWFFFFIKFQNILYPGYHGRFALVWVWLYLLYAFRVLFLLLLSGIWGYMGNRNGKWRIREIIYSFLSSFLWAFTYLLLIFIFFLFFFNLFIFDS